MSKSKGNVVSPQKVMDQYGADILRLWVATTDYSGELTISDEILKRVVESYRRIRNTLKFLLANLSDFDSKAHALPVADWLEIDRYMLARTRELQDKFKAHYDDYEFHFIVQNLQSFCSEDLGGFYLDILKDRLYTSGSNSRARRSAQNALFHITHALTRWMAPILSFTGEEVWTQLAGEDSSVFLHTWHALPEQPDEVEYRLQMRWGLIRTVRANVLKEMETKRAAGTIGSSLQAEIEIQTHAEAEDIRAVLDSLGDDLRFVLITSQARVVAAEEGRIVVTQSAAKKCDRCWHYRDDVDAHADHPGLCGRCVSNLYGEGEARSHA
jgi:isoleucyl-tRNA synthetase